MEVIFYIILFFIGYLVIGGIIIQIFSFFKGLFCGRDIVRKDDFGEVAENIGDALRSAISDKLDERREKKELDEEYKRAIIELNRKRKRDESNSNN